MDTSTNIIGEERRLVDILSDEDIIPLLGIAVEAGADEASLRDETGAVLWRSGERKVTSRISSELPLRLEGEVVGSVCVAGESSGGVQPETLALILLHSVNAILKNNIKRIFITQIHSKVVDLSYEELVEKNRRLALSEDSYRKLAETLERKVLERTEELKAAHLKLIQQEKMTSIGQLAAGVAHEVNNPLGFVISNLNTLKNYAEKYLLMADRYRAAASTGTIAAESAQRFWKDQKMDYVCGDILPLITQSVDGAERVKKIVSDLKGFSHVDDGRHAAVDLNAEIERTLSVLCHEIPPDTEIVRDYGLIDPFSCNPGLFCQVFLNIIRNAIQTRQDGLRLLIRSIRTGRGTVITFTDNGPGIPPEIMTRIFEPFFTTRDVGQGQGLGLAVAYDIVTGYGGTLEVSCPAGGGTVFTITLPLKKDT